jgi:hypothetical protein
MKYEGVSVAVMNPRMLQAPGQWGGSDAIAVHLQADRLQLSEDDARDWREKLGHFVVGYGSVVGIDLNCRLE